MYFYVDESGQTGKNLFDPAQPCLCYGVLSSRINLDILALPYLKGLRRKFGVERLHAAKLGEAKLSTIVPDLLHIHKKYGLRFDLYKVVKADYALINFFDQVFDQGINPAVSWPIYWTPLRYIMLLRLAPLFDDDTLKKAWEARIELDVVKAQTLFIEVCQVINERIHHLSDLRLQQLVKDALQWAQDHPANIDYNVSSKDDLLQVTPNLIGFQFVLHGIARRILRHKKQASRITVDHQSQFNAAQQALQNYYLQMPNDQIYQLGPGLPQMSWKGMPTIPVTFLSSKDSAGLELVDIFLWIFKRQMEGKDLDSGLLPLLYGRAHWGYVNEVSLKALAARWGKVFQNQPNLTADEVAALKEIMAVSEKERRKAISKK